MNSDTPLVKRAYNLGLKAVPNFATLSANQIAYYESHLDELPAAITRGFIIPVSSPEFMLFMLDFIIHVDRSVKPNYPARMKEVMDPELEFAGPAEYDLSQVEQWLHGDQYHGCARGVNIYRYLQNSEEGALATCLNLQDGFAIQQKGIAVFRKLFTNKSVHLWCSVIRDQDDDLYVPCLYDHGGKVLMGWRWLNVSDWNSNAPALRFNSK